MYCIQIDLKYADILMILYNFYQLPVWISMVFSFKHRQQNTEEECNTSKTTKSNSCKQINTNF